MKSTLLLCLTIATLAGAVLAEPPASQPAEAAAAANWPGFLGAGPQGAVMVGQPAPADLSLPRDLRFKVVVPAEGNSSPIVWGERIFLTGEGQRVLAFDRATGKLLWDAKVNAPPPVKLPGDEPFEVQAEDTGMAAPTACTDGRFVYAFFGTGVMGCLDMQGKQVWARRIVPGEPQNTFGLAASPVLYKDLVIQLVDMGTEPEAGLSFLVAVSARDGKQVWQADRETASSWTTPLLIHAAGRDQLITTAMPYVISYDPASGKELWRAEEISGDAAARAVFCDGVLYAPSGEGGKLYALRVDGKGDVTRTHMLWAEQSPLPDVASPVCAGDRYYQVTAGGDACCYSAKGKRLWQTDVGKPVWASPVLSAGRLYVINTSGKMSVLSAETGKQIGKLDLGEKVVTTPAAVDGRFYIRGQKHLMCIGRP